MGGNIVCKLQYDALYAQYICGNACIKQTYREREREREKVVQYCAQAILNDVQLALAVVYISEPWSR
jgi:hypothetical protein